MPAVSFDGACALIETALQGGARRDILEGVSASNDFTQALRRLREVTTRHGVLLIFDEVISGFRCSPGGAQQFYGVTPDLTTLGKILAGGYPGAALSGRADVLQVLDYRRCEERLQSPLVAHQGTYNAGPVSAAAGIATLEETGPAL